LGKYIVTIPPKNAVPKDNDLRASLNGCYDTDTKYYEDLNKGLKIRKLLPGTVFKSLAQLRVDAKDTIKATTDSLYTELYNTNSKPAFTYTIYGTSKQVAKYGIIKNTNGQPALENFNPPATGKYFPPSGYNFFNRENILAVHNSNKTSKFSDVIYKLSQLDKNSYNSHAPTSPTSPITISTSFCASNPELLKASKFINDNPINKGRPSLCDFLDNVQKQTLPKPNSSIIANPNKCLSKTDEQGSGLDLDEHICRASKAPLTGLDPATEGSIASQTFTVNESLIWIRAVTKLGNIKSNYNPSYRAYNNNATSLDPMVENLQLLAKAPILALIGYKAIIFSMFLFALFILLANTIKNIVISPMWAATLTKQSQQEGVSSDQLNGFKEILYIILYPSILLISIMVTFYSLSFITSILSTFILAIGILFPRTFITLLKQH